MKLYTAILGAALAVTAVLQAQSFDDRINVRMPAPVVVNGVTIPAGDASIQILHNTGTMMLTVRAESGEHATVLVTRVDAGENLSGAAKVVLDQKDGTYYFNRIILPDNTALQVLDAR